MRSTTTRSDALNILVAALQSGVCDEAAARELYALGAEAVTLALLTAARRVAEQDARVALLEARASAGGGRCGTGRGHHPGRLAMAERETQDGRRRRRPARAAGGPGTGQPGAHPGVGGAGAATSAGVSPSAGGRADPLPESDAGHADASRTEAAQRPDGLERRRTAGAGGANAVAGGRCAGRVVARPAADRTGALAAGGNAGRPGNRPARRVGAGRSTRGSASHDSGRGTADGGGHRHGVGPAATIPHPPAGGRVRGAGAATRPGRWTAAVASPSGAVPCCGRGSTRRPGWRCAATPSGRRSFCGWGAATRNAASQRLWP